MLIDRHTAKLKYITFAPCVTAPLSILGSSLTLLTIYRTKSSIPLTTYHRLVMGICVSDLIFSTALALGPWPAPQAVTLYGYVGARGTLQTCAAQGFFVLLGASSLGYTTMLMWFYVMVIVFNWKERRILQIEPFLHALPVAFYTVSAILALAKEMLTFSGAFCFLGAWPLGCVKSDRIECQRGGNIRTFSLWTGTIPILVWNGLSVIALMLVGGTVAIQFRRNRRFEFQANIVERRRSFGVTSSSGHSSPGLSSSTFTHTQVLMQCWLYAVQFVNVAIWVSITSVMEIVSDDFQALGKHFWIFALGITLFPLQGFFLALIFLRPRYVNARTLNPELSRWQCLFGSIWNPSISNARHVATARRRRSTATEFGSPALFSGNTNNRSSFASGGAASGAGAQCSKTSIGTPEEMNPESTLSLGTPTTGS